MIFGLGNPGRRYRFTRHNAGWMACEHLAGQLGIDLLEDGFFCRYGIGHLGNEEVLIALCQTYMNQSGEAVAAVTDAFPVPRKDWLAVTDDFHLPLGTLRLRRTGSSGGHKGLESIYRKTGTDFGRLRLGIGPKPMEGDIPSFVLSRFSRVEQSAAQNAFGRASEALMDFIRYGMDEAMTRHNAAPQ